VAVTGIGKDKDVFLKNMLKSISSLIVYGAFTWFNISDRVNFLPDPTLFQPHLVIHWVNA
jgi:hypothetical protein